MANKCFSTYSSFIHAPNELKKIYRMVWSVCREALWDQNKEWQEANLLEHVFSTKMIFTLRVGFVCMSSPLAWYLMVRLDLSMLRGYNVWDGSCQRAFQSVRILKFEMFVWNVLIDWRDYLKSTRENKNHPIYFFKLYGWVNSYACIRSFQGLKMYQFSVMVPVLSHFHRMSSWI